MKEKILWLENQVYQMIKHTTDKSKVLEELERTVDLFMECPHIIFDAVFKERNIDGATSYVCGCKNCGKVSRLYDNKGEWLEAQADHYGGLSEDFKVLSEEAAVDDLKIKVGKK